MEAAHAHSEVRVSVPLPYTCKLIVQWLYGIVYIGCGLVRAMMRERISSVLDSNWRRWSDTQWLCNFPTPSQTFCSGG